MPKTAPFWSLVELISETQLPSDLRVSLEDMVSKTGRLVDGKLSWYEAPGTPFEAGDVLFGKLRPYLAKYWHATRSGTAGGDIHVYRPAENVDSRFLSYIVGSPEFVKFAEAASKGVKMPRVEWMGLREFEVYRPDLTTQRRVADYLDRETGEIDMMISKMDKLAYTLKMRKKASPSFVWNQDFDQVKLKWLMQEVDNRAGDQSHLPLLSVSIHHGVQLRSESTSKQSASEDLSHYKITTPGQIVLNRMRAFQGGLGQTRLDGLVSPDYAVLEMLPSLTPDWAERVMRTPEFVNKMTQSLRGIGTPDGTNTRTPRINVRDLLELTIPLPAFDEQKRIADHLDQVIGRIDAMLAKVDELKSLLAERRATLVSDVVAGRKVIA